MLAKLYSGAVVGLEGELVEVEVSIGSGLPAFHIVGLPDTMVTESKERVRAAVANSGFKFPRRRMPCNLPPADVKKEGPNFDLPIALGVVMCSDQLLADTSKSLFLGELSMDGRLRPTHG